MLCYEKHKEEQKQINRVRALEYYYKILRKEGNIIKNIGKIIIMNYTQNDY